MFLLGNGLFTQVTPQVRAFHKSPVIFLEVTLTYPFPTLKKGYCRDFRERFLLWFQFPPRKLKHQFTCSLYLVITRGLDLLERRHWAAILFIVEPSNALQLTEKLRKQDGGAHAFCTLNASSLVYPGLISGDHAVSFKVKTFLPLPWYPDITFYNITEINNIRSQE